LVALSLEVALEVELVVALPTAPLLEDLEQPAAKMRVAQINMMVVFISLYSVFQTGLFSAYGVPTVAVVQKSPQQGTAS
jgi:hypothetical protein